MNYDSETKIWSTPIHYKGEDCMLLATKDVVKIDKIDRLSDGTEIPGDTIARVERESCDQIMLVFHARAWRELGLPNGL
jgi:hypothetical protein